MAEIVDRHLKIQTEEELIDYIYDMVRVNYGFNRLDMDILPPKDEDDETLVVGWYNEMYFEICFVPGKYLILSTSAAKSKEEQIIEGILSPLMWRECDEDSVAPKVDGMVFINPIYDVIYTQLGLHKIMWDTYNPEQSMQNLMFEKLILKEGMQDLQI